MQKEVKHYKVKSLPAILCPDSIYYVKETSQSSVKTYITDQTGFPFPLVDLQGGGGGTGNVQTVTGTGVAGTPENPIVNISTFKSSELGNLIQLSSLDGKLFVKPITSPDGSINIVETSTALQLQLGSSLQTQIQNALQTGDNISELTNDVGYITLADIPFSSVSATTWTPNHTVTTGNPYLAGTIVYYLGNIFQANFDNDSIVPTIGGNLYWTDLGAGYLIDQEQTDWLAISGSAFIKNKPTNVSSFTNDAGYATQSWVSSNYYPLNSNPSGYLISSALSPYLLISTAASTYYPLSNPSGFVNNTFVASNYYPLNSNPANFVTNVTATSPITSSGGTTPVISTSMSTNKLIGRSTAGTGVMEEITIGTGLNLSGGTLNSTAEGILHGTASGTDTYTVTIAGATAYADGDAYLIRFPNGNTGSATINISGLGAVGLYRNNDGLVIGGDIWNGAEMLCIYNSTIGGFQLIGTSPNAMYAYITNADSVTITKGQVVYAFGGQGDRMTVKLANNVGDATSAQTVGVVLSTSIAANQRGVIITQGLLDGLSILPTATFSDGDPLYLGTTAGSITNIKPYAPNHLVYLGNVTTASNGSSGRWYVRVQNGYELDELHDVDLISNAPTNGQVLTYESLTGLWKNQNVPTELPTQTGNTGKFLFTDGTSASWNFPSRHYKLGFNNIAEYTVVGGSGVQNLGAGTLGMSLTQDLPSLLYGISGTDYVIKCRVITAEQFGGTTNQIGLRVTYSSANGATFTDQLLIANRIIQFGSNFAIQVANLNFTIPINYLGAPTDYFRFDVIMNRLPAGNTSVFSSELIFST